MDFLEFSNMRIIAAVREKNNFCVNVALEFILQRRNGTILDNLAMVDDGNFFTYALNIVSVMRG